MSQVQHNRQDPVGMTDLDTELADTVFMLRCRIQVWETMVHGPKARAELDDMIKCVDLAEQGKVTEALKAAEMLHVNYGTELP